MEHERCCHCGELTGRAGISDDSIYVDLSDGTLGPLCADCFDKYFNTATPLHVDILQLEVEGLRDAAKQAEQLIALWMNRQIRAELGFVQWEYIPIDLPDLGPCLVIQAEEFVKLTSNIKKMMDRIRELENRLAARPEI